MKRLIILAAAIVGSVIAGCLQINIYTCECCQWSSQNKGTNENEVVEVKSDGAMSDLRPTYKQEGFEVSEVIE